MISFLLYTHGMNDARIAAHYSRYSSAKTTLRILFSHIVINLQSSRGTSHCHLTLVLYTEPLLNPTSNMFFFYFLLQSPPKYAEYTQSGFSNFPGVWESP